MAPPAACEPFGFWSWSFVLILNALFPMMTNQCVSSFAYLMWVASLCSCPHSLRVSRPCQLSDLMIVSTW